MPAKKKATEPIDVPVITPANTKIIKGKAATKAAEVAPIAQVETKASSVKTKATPTKAQPEGVKSTKAIKEKQPKPVTITRTELAIEIVKAVGQYMTITGQESEAIVSEIINTMIDSLKERNKVEIRGFGSFRLRSRRARVGRNPKTGIKVEVPSKNVVYFKLGKDLKAILLDKETNNTSTPDLVAALPSVKPVKVSKTAKRKSS